ncbi:MAG: DUF434 domain-containing protein [Treponema sp.]|nr:DUF434 domain-containing protein [Treponema sp.]
MFLTPPFRSAARDYRLLLDRGYPSAACLKLVGDRWALDKAARTVLFRGILPESQSSAISARVVRTLPPRARLAVDGYNVLFTLSNYRRGHPLFIGTDGLVRDAGGAHGRIQDQDLFLECAGAAVRRLSVLGVAYAEVYLDAPVSGSGAHAASLRDLLARAGVPGRVELAASADGPVRDFEDGYAATSDSAVAAAAVSPIFDLARDILESRYGAEFPDLGIVVRSL